MNSPASLALAITALTVFAACSPSERPDTAGAGPGDDTNIYGYALAHPARSDADRARDASRKPDKVLEFLRIEPGMDVLDLFSGGGYYSEMVSYVVGEEGSVTSHSNEAYMGFVGDEFPARHADGRLTNVTVLMAENNELELDPGSYDAVLMMLTFHDLYHVDLENGWAEIDDEKLLAELYAALRPGGIVGIVDHYAETGAPKETGDTVHRIDPAIVISEMEAAGFELDKKSDMLRSVEDDYSKVVFDPAVRGKTDRFVLRFVKPE